MVVPEADGVRWAWLKGMYIYTALAAGLFGLGMLVSPSAVQSALCLPDQDPIVFGVVGSVYVASGLVALLGLRAPLRFAPVLLLQLAYKTIWLIAVALPLAVRGAFPAHGLPFLVIFATYIVGDLVAIPFPRVFARERAE
jgi:hypothetical protein